MWASFESAVCTLLPSHRKDEESQGRQDLPRFHKGTVTRPIMERMCGMRGCHPRKWFAGPPWSAGRPMLIDKGNEANPSQLREGVRTYRRSWGFPGAHWREKISMLWRACRKACSIVRVNVEQWDRLDCSLEFDRIFACGWSMKS